MRSAASILHLDMDAFFAAVEQRDKPSLRGRQVIVGGVGGRGVVSTASYEVRPLGVHSAMPMSEARRRAPHAAVLGVRSAAYRQSSRIVMAILRELSPVLEPMSLDEAYVDLAAGGVDCSDVAALPTLVAELRAEVTRRTEGLTCSVGVGSSRLVAKLASEAAKPNGQLVVAPGTELDLITPLSAHQLPGIGPATMEKLTRLGIRSVRDLQRATLTELVHEVGRAAGEAIHAMAFARDERPVLPERAVKSISVEDTFERDLNRVDDLNRVIETDARVLASRLARAGLFARTVTLKLKLPDFTIHARSRTLTGATDQPDRIGAVARALLADFDVRDGVRLLGVGVSNFTVAAQEELFYLDDDRFGRDEVVVQGHDGQSGAALARGGGTGHEPRLRFGTDWVPGLDVEHQQHGRGWVWGSGAGVVTVRFETRDTAVGPVRSFRVDDPALRRAPRPLPMRWEVPEGEGD